MTDLQLTIRVAADGKSAKAELTTINGELVKMEKSAASATTQTVRGFGLARQGIESISQSLKFARNAFLAYHAAHQAAMQTRDIIAAADAWTGMNARLKLVTGTTREFDTAMQQVSGIATTYQARLTDVAGAYARIAPIAQTMGRSQQDVADSLRALAASLKISGANTVDTAETFRQFTQALSGPTVQMQEMNTIIDANSALWLGLQRQFPDLIAKHGSLKAAIAAQALSNQDLLRATIAMKSEFERQASTITTVAGAWTNIGSAMTAFIGRADQAFGTSARLAEIMNTLAAGLDRAAGALQGLFPENAPGDQVAAFTAQIASLQERIERESNKPLAFLNTEKIARMRQSLVDMEATLQRLRNTAEQAANAGTAAFQGMGYRIEDVGKKADATIAALTDAAKKYGIPENVLVTVAKLESNFNQLAVSGKGALGVMQLMPGTAKDLGVNALDAAQNIEGGARYLKKMLDMFKQDLPSALAAYNMGPGNFQRYGLGSKAAQEYLAAYDLAAQELKAKYPNGLLADLLSPKEQQAIQDASYGSFVAHLQSIEAAAKASAERQKASLETRIAEQEATLQRVQDAAKLDIEGATGADRAAAVSRAYEQERQMLQQIAVLKGQQVAVDEAAARATLDAINQQIAAADRYRLTEAQRQDLQGQKIQAETELAGLAEQRAQREIEAGRKIADAAQSVTEARVRQTREEQQSIAAIEDYIARMEEKNQALAAGNELLAEEAELAKFIAAIPAGVDDGGRVEKARQLLQQYKGLKKAAEEQQKAEKSVADERLRQGQYFQVMVNQAQSAAKSLKEAFGDVGESLGGVWVAFAENAQYAYQIQSQLADQLKNLGDSEADRAKAMELQGRANNDLLAAQLGMWGQATSAAAGFFDKGSSGYETLRGASQAFHVAQMAIYAAEQVQAAILGIANQAQGDPYSAWARMAAMATAMAALGISVANGGGGAGAAERGARHAQNKGTVLGDDSADSKSIANSLKVLQDNSSTDLDYSAQMTRSLQNIEYAMAGVARSVLVNVSAVSGLAGQRPKAQGMGIIPGIKDPIIGDFLFKSTAKIKDWGIGAWPQQLSEILKSGSMQLKTWTDVEFKTSLLGLITVSKKTKTYLSDASTEMEREFGRVILSLVDGLREGAKAFGMGGDEFTRQLQDFQIQWDAQSLKDLKGEELADAISAQFSAIADKMAAALNIQALDEFQQIGEGMFETLTRVSGGINQARAELEALNIRMIDYRDLTYKQGDVAGELARESIIAFEGAGSAIGKFMADAVGSIEDILETYRDLRAITDAMNALGLEAGNLTRAMTEAVGGVSALRDAMDAFQGNFYNAGEQLGVMLESLARQFGALGYAIPDSKEAFRALVESIDTSTESGQKLFARLISLSEAFAEAADSAQALDDLLQSYTDPLAKFKEPLQRVIDDFAAILDGKLAAISAGFRNQAEIDKKAFGDPYRSQVDQKTAYIQGRQTELMSNLRDLEVTNGRISELQDLIARWSGTKGAAGYVAAWQAELEGMQRQAEALKGSIAGKTAEIERINGEIQALLTALASGEADIDAAALTASLEALREAKRDILQAEGDALLATLRDLWDGLISGIREAQRSLARQIAELQDPGALRKYTMGEAKRTFKAAMNYQGDDPEKALELIQNAQSAIMDAYAQQMAKIEKQIQRQTRQIDRQYDKLIRAEQKALDKKIEAINIERDAALQALQDRTDARIEALNDLQDAELKALDKRYEAEQKALQGQIDTAKRLQDAIKGVQDYLKNLTLGQFSNLSPEDKLREAQRQFNDALLKTQAGDAEAASKLTSASDAYLQAAQAYFASSPEYGQILQQVQAALGVVAGMQTTDPDSVQARIDALREQQQVDAEAIREKFQDQIDAVRDGADKTAEAINKAADLQIERAERRTDRAIAALERERDKTIRDLSDPEKNEAIKALRKRAIDALKALQDKLAEEEQKARDKMKDLIEEVKDLGVLNAAQLRQLNRMAEKMGAAIEPVPTYATGGATPGGYAWVGEKGPEPVFFAGPARVVSHQDAMTALGSEESAKEIRLMREELRREFRALVVTQTETNPKTVGALERIDERLSAMERRQRLSA